MKTAPRPLVLCKLTSSDIEPGFGMALMTPLLSVYCTHNVVYFVTTQKY